MTTVTFSIKDSEIESKEIDKLVNKNFGDFNKTTTSDGWSYKVDFDVDMNGKNFTDNLHQDYPELDFEITTIK